MIKLKGASNKFGKSDQFPYSEEWTMRMRCHHILHSSSADIQLNTKLFASFFVTWDHFITKYNLDFSKYFIFIIKILMALIRFAPATHPYIQGIGI